MDVPNPVDTKVSSAVMDSGLEHEYRTVLQSSLRGTAPQGREFEVECPSGGVYLGFQPFTDSDRRYYGSDIIGIAYVYVVDIEHHLNVSSVHGDSQSSDFMHTKTPFLNELNTEAVQLLVEECGISSDLDFIRYSIPDEPESENGGVYYGLPVPRPSTVNTF